ncbi:hypothetical protein EGW08_013877 [Elysia chlorotica]|uniref:Flavin-containing monooxygenase n=1 Tax=Elysia chlorotica TaxID=188477 RepID=A0A433T9T5_ELYCH|nr:hypothetical protein EGW08_013877 [Elysia chlorotica]
MTEKDVIVIGAGISGLAAAKCLKDDGFDVLLLERSGDIGGLWNYREGDYGVMKFTHINVSKYNYAFSDFPFPDGVPDFPHQSDMCQYIRDYADHFGLTKLVEFHVKVTSVEQIGEKWRVTGKQFKPGLEGEGQEVTYVSQFVAISTGHHAKPTLPKIKGEESFTGEIIHSVDYKDAIVNGCVDKKVLVVGIGNSAVDVAVNCVDAGRCKPVCLSTRSGAWIFPNYFFGFPTDLYANRVVLNGPIFVLNFIMELLICLITGSPWRWGLNPKMKALQTQPTVSPTLIHHVQRGNIKIMPNITHIDGSLVHFVNGSSIEADRIIYCTGYSIDLPFLSQSVKDQVMDEASNKIKLYKNVFSSSIGPSLAFIGFTQPASGGLLGMSEIQARWFSKLCKGSVKLPSKQEMDDNMEAEMKASLERYYNSARHTIQKDPIIYNDDIASMIGAKPDIFSHPTLAFRLLLGSCGAAQWRLDGPNKWTGAAQQIRKTPIPDLWVYTGYAALALILWLTYRVACLFCCLF